MDYLNVLARVYKRHKEYNAYKHGLRVFPGQSSFRAIDEATGETVTDIQGDFLEFLTPKHQQEQEYEYRIRHTSKEYDIRADMHLIRITTWLLQNFFERKRLQLKTPQGQKFSFNYIFLMALQQWNYFPLATLR